MTNGEFDLLSEKEIRKHLSNDSFCRDIIILNEVDSTNNYAKESASKGASHGTLVTAETQTAGKGRLGRKFCSPKGSGIYMSLILRLDSEIETSLLITSAIAVAVMRAIKKVCGVQTEIKWINDIYLNGKKLCGILTEASVDFQNNKLRYTVIGIGINLSDEAFPPEIKEIAAALSEVCEKSISRNELIAEIINQTEIVVDGLDKGEFFEDYKKHSFVLGSVVNVITPVGSYKAEAVDITKSGHLLVKTENGEINELNSGEISIRKA